MLTYVHSYPAGTTECVHSEISVTSGLKNIFLSNTSNFADAFFKYFPTKFLQRFSFLRLNALGQHFKMDNDIYTDIQNITSRTILSHGN